MEISIRCGRVAAVLVAALLPTAAMAQSGADRFHAAVGLLYTVPTVSDLSLKVGGATLKTGLEAGRSVGIVASLGYGADPGLRGEVELGYRNVGLRRFDGFRVSRAEGSEVEVEGEVLVAGDRTTTSLMVNGHLVFEAGRLRPYLGVGIGLARHVLTFDAQAFGSGVNSVGTRESSHEDTVVAYQGMVGISRPMSENAEARLGYRYIATGDLKSDGTRASFGSHNLELGVVIRF